MIRVIIFFVILTRRYIAANTLNMKNRYVTSHAKTYTNGFPFSNGNLFTSRFSSVHKKFASVRTAWAIRLKSAPSISSSLTATSNLSISSGIFPDLWNIAKVSPLRKDDSLFDRSNYRPISVLPVVSKILARHVHQTFYNFPSQHELF